MMNIKMILIGLAVLTVLSVFGTVYIKGRAAGVRACTEQAAKTFKEDVEKNEKIDKRVNKLPVTDLDRALSNWVR